MRSGRAFGTEVFVLVADGSEGVIEVIRLSSIVTSHNDPAGRLGKWMPSNLRAISVVVRYLAHPAHRCPQLKLFSGGGSALWLCECSRPLQLALIALTIARDLNEAMHFLERSLDTSSFYRS